MFEQPHFIWGYGRVVVVKRMANELGIAVTSMFDDGILLIL